MNIHHCFRKEMLFLSQISLILYTSEIIDNFQFITTTNLLPLESMYFEDSFLLRLDLDTNGIRRKF